MQNITFDVDFTEAVFKDNSNRISGVVLLGSVSKNRRQYTESCMRNAVPLFENCQAFINHPNADELKVGRRDVMLLAGKYVNCRFDESKVKGDFLGLPDDPAAKKYITIAQNMPDIAGNSQNARGRMRVQNGVEIVEEIKEVLSVDLVAKPATTSNIFETHKRKRGEDKLLTPKKAARMMKGLLTESLGGDAILTGVGDYRKYEKKDEKSGNGEDGSREFTATEAARLLR